LGAGQVAFPVYNHQAGTNWRGILIGTRDRPALEYLTGLCTNPSPGSAYYCIRPPIGDLKAQGSLFVFDSLECQDFYCAQPCPLPPGDRQFYGLRDGVAVLVSGRAIHLLRLTDGHDAVIEPPGTGRVLAQLDESGLFYSYSVYDPTYPGRVAFLSFSQLPID